MGRLPLASERAQSGLIAALFHDSDMRTRLVSIAMLAVFGVLALRAGAIALGGTASVADRSRVVSDMPRRSDIVDRNGVLLATSVTAYSVYADPRAMMDPTLVADQLMQALPDLDRDTILGRLSNKDRAFVWIKRGLTPRQRQQVFELGLEGVGFREETRRAYPRGHLAGHVLGYAGADGQGLSGIEHRLEERLSAGGAPVRLSLDANVQFSLEAELASAVDRFDAEAGAGVVLKAETGEVLGLASWPVLNPNLGTQIDRDAPELLNRASAAVYELGSVYKPLTVGLALERGTIQSQQRFAVDEPLEIRGQLIEDDHPIAPRATPLEIVSDSSNIGTVRVAQTLSQSDHRAGLDSLGLLTRPDIDLTGVARPLVPESWDELTRATVSYGHGIAVSPLMLASAYTVFANDGVRRSPRLVLDGDGQPLNGVDGTPVFSAETTARLLEMLRHAVEFGTGTRANVAGYAVAGKTGTAEKPIAGGYSEDQNICSFAAIFPADSPEFVVLIVLDAPKSGESWGRTASWNAAPTAGRVVERIAPILGVEPELSASIGPRLSDEASEGSRL